MNLSGMFRHIHLFSPLVLLFLLAPPSFAQAEPIKTLRETEYPATGVTLGNGWNLVANRKTSGNCLTYATHDDNSQTATVELTRVHTLYQFLRTTDFNAKLNTGNLFGTNNASATFGLMKKIDLNTEATNYAVRADVRLGPSFVTPAAPGQNIALTAAAIALYNTNRAQFRAQCGDAFVSVIYRGATLQGVISDTSNKLTNVVEEKSSGEVSYAGASASVSFTDFSQIVNNRDTLTVKVVVHGGSGVTLATSADSLLNAVNTFPTTAATNPANLSIGLTSYASVAGWPGGSQGTISKNDLIENLIADYYDFKIVYDILTGAIDAPEHFFSLKPIAELKTWQDEVRRKHMEPIRNKINSCVASDTTASCNLIQSRDALIWSYRRSLPMPINKIPNYGAFMTAYSELQRTRYQLFKTPDTILFDLQIGLPPIALPNPRLVELKNSIADQKNKLLLIREAQIENVSKSLYLWNILSYVRTECLQSDLKSRRCLNNAQMDAQQALIKQEVNSLYSPTLPLARFHASSITALIPRDVEVARE